MLISWIIHDQTGINLPTPLEKFRANTSISLSIFFILPIFLIMLHITFFILSYYNLRSVVKPFHWTPAKLSFKALEIELRLEPDSILTGFLYFLHNFLTRLQAL